MKRVAAGQDRPHARGEIRVRLWSQCVLSFQSSAHAEDRCLRWCWFCLMSCFVFWVFFFPPISFNVLFPSYHSLASVLISTESLLCRRRLSRRHFITKWDWTSKVRSDLGEPGTVCDGEFGGCISVALPTVYPKLRLYLLFICDSYGHSTQR